MAISKKKARKDRKAAAAQAARAARDASHEDITVTTTGIHSKLARECRKYNYVPQRPGFQKSVGGWQNSW